jgi:hypothetical protein
MTADACRVGDLLEHVDLAGGALPVPLDDVTGYLRAS